jgi:uncharacterized protein YjiS (DUF1127 family)
LFAESVERADRPELNTWLPQPKTAASLSWIITSRKRLRFLNASVELKIHHMDLPEIEEKARLTKGVWAYCNGIRGRRSAYYRERKYSNRKLAKLSSDALSDIGYDFNLAYLVAKAHEETCALQKTHTPELTRDWIPFHSRQLTYWGTSFQLGNAKLVLNAATFPPPVSFCAGSLNRDETGRWFIDTSYEVCELDMRVNLS